MGIQLLAKALTVYRRRARWNMVIAGSSDASASRVDALVGRGRGS